MSTIQRPTSIIKQTIDILRQKIQTGEFTSEGRMLSETELATELGVSRTTIRSALSRLEAEGVVSRRHGAGTFVNRRAMEINATLNRIWDFQHMISDSGRTPSVQFISFSTRKPSEEEIELFGLNPEMDLQALERLFWADDIPVIYSSNLFPSAVFCTTGDEVRFDLPIHRFLEYHCGEKIGYSVNNLSAVEAPEGLERWLQIPRGKPVLRFVDIFYSAQDEELMYGINYYNDKILRIRIARSWGQEQS
jgi:GntR family transcriptional regulator